PAAPARPSATRRDGRRSLFLPLERDQGVAGDAKEKERRPLEPKSANGLQRGKILALDGVERRRTGHARRRHRPEGQLTFREGGSPRDAVAADRRGEAVSGKFGMGP